MQLRCRR